MLLADEADYRWAAGLIRAHELGARAEVLLSPVHGRLDRGRVFADLACAVADGARVISDFRVMGDQDEVFRPGRVGPDRVADAEGGRRRGPSARRKGSPLR